MGSWGGSIVSVLCSVILNEDCEPVLYCSLPITIIFEILSSSSKCLCFLLYCSTWHSTSFPGSLLFFASLGGETLGTKLVGTWSLRFETANVSCKQKLRQYSDLNLSSPCLQIQVLL